MGRRGRRGRTVNGIVLLDKPSGMTSNAALQTVKRLFDARKAGHTGSLDPLATGLLPICLGEATKISSFLLDADKYYHFSVRLGERTDSGDADGEVIERRSPAGIDWAVIEAALAPLRGNIEQTPPMRSALKHAGRPLYEYARRGEPVERAPRPACIHQLDFVGLNGPEAELSVHCSKGTYVRTLADDLGEALGCGGHVVALRRTGTGPFVDPELVSLETLQASEREGGLPALDRHLTPMDAALVSWPAVEVSSEIADYLRNGQAVQIPKTPTAGTVRLYERDADLIGMGRVQDDGRIAPKRLIVHH